MPIPSVSQRALAAALTQFTMSSLFASARKYRVSLIIASALFMENLDSTIITTSLPAIATSLDVPILHLNLAVTSYLLSLAVFIPLSGWIADRYGARNVFRCAIAIFTVGSLLCGVSVSAPMLIVSRVLQGIGGAMMSPVGRLVLLRTVPKGELVQAMAYLTIPALIGPVVGPPLGGFISTYFSWRWIFFINLPIGLLGIWLATRYLEDIRESDVPPLDLRGSVLAGLGLAGLVFGFETVDRGIVSPDATAAMVACGILGLALYVLHARRTPHAIVDLSLLRIPTFAWSILGGTIFRIGVGSLQILLPLMLQVGFGMSPFASGLLTFAGAAGSMPMKATAPFILQIFGFRTAMIGASLINGAFLFGYTLFTQQTPPVLIFLVLFAAGFVRSLQFTSVNAITYADVSNRDMSKATSFASMAQQLSVSIGVATGAFLLHKSMAWRGGAELSAADFIPAYVVVGIITLSSALCFMRLGAGAGQEISGRLTGRKAEPAE